jgi:hypothetical protein
MANLIPKVLKRVMGDIKSQRLNRGELAFMIQEFERVAQLEWSEADYSMEPIRQTNGKWYRQKPLRNNAVYPIRNIINIDREKQVIELVAILRKTNTT